jgi:putative DNA primase/helicase
MLAGAAGKAAALAEKMSRHEAGCCKSIPCGGPIVTFDEFKQHYEAKTGKQIKGNGSCCCPAHDDRQASLSAKEGDDGRILLCCHAGCETKDVVAKLGLTMADLMPANGSAYRASQAKKSGPGRKTVYESMRKAADAAVWFVKRNHPDAKSGPVWEYKNVDGSIYAAVVRIDLPTPNGERGQKVFKPLCQVLDGWQVGDPKIWYPYRVGSIRESDTAHVVEGEKCADALANMRFPAVTSAHGAKSARKTDWKALEGKTIYLWPDNDDAGRQYIADVGRILNELGCKLYVVELPGLAEHEDVADYLAKMPEDNDQRRTELQKLCDAAKAYQPPADEVSSSSASKKGSRNGGKSAAVADAIIGLTGDDEFFHDADGAAFVSFEIPNAADNSPGKHRENWPLASKTYKQLLANRYYMDIKKVPDASALENAINALEFQARAGNEYIVGLRRIQVEGSIYLDLADAAWTIIEIDARGWRLCNHPPVRFIRRNGLLPLPMPVRGGNIDDLRPLLNVDDDQWILCKAWLLSAFNGEMSLPILAVNGEQGSAKSTLCRILRQLIDPNKALLRSFPRDERDLIISANNGLVMAFDNLSGLSPTMADALCRLSTGAGFSTRALYSDDEEAIFSGRRSIIINGIEDLAGRADLLDRSITLTLRPLSDNNRREEKDIQSKFDHLHPGLLGALLDAVSAALRNGPNVKVENMPRMADFARWTVAGEVVLKIPEGRFLTAYRDNIGGSNELALESSPIYEPIKKLLELKPEHRWEGTATELLEELNGVAGFTGTGETKPSKDWPSSPRALRSKINRVAPNFRRAGIDIETGRTKQSRRITLSLKRPKENTAAQIGGSDGSCVTKTGICVTDRHPKNNENGAFLRNGDGMTQMTVSAETSMASAPVEVEEGSL